MSAAYRLFIALICLSPLFLAFDSLLVRGILTGYVAFLVLIIALSIRPGEAAFLSGVIRPALLIAALPAAWILIQALPLPIHDIQHPIWTSARAALGKPLLGSISISPGAALISLVRYFSACGMFFVAAAVSIDRARAETILVWLAALATALAALLVVHDLGGFLFLGEISSIGRRAAISAAATLGTVLTASMAIYAVERYETRRNRADFSLHLFIATLASAIAGFVICWIAIIFFTSSAALFAGLTGTGAFVLVIGFRRLGLGPRMCFVLAAVAISVPISLVAHDFFVKSPDLTLRFDREEPRSIIDLTQRIITDTPWAGSGAGTFSALLPIYRDTPNVIIAPVAPTTAAAISIELGRPALWLMVVGVLAAIIWLIHGALQRGRNSFYPAAGASSAIILLIEAFFDASLLASTTIVLATSVLGLALAQSVSRTAR